MPQFSIIVPVYNVQNYLAACVKSVAEQPGPRDWECILVDDGSTDASGQICDVLAAEIPGLRVLHQQNGGLANARNTGLAAAKGEWVLFLDSDDAMAPGLLETLRRELAAHPEFDWFSAISPEVRGTWPMYGSRMPRSRITSSVPSLPTAAPTFRWPSARGGSSTTGFST